MFITKNKEKESFLITTIPLLIKESLKMECPTVKESLHPRTELNFKHNGLMELILVSFDLFFNTLLKIFKNFYYFKKSSKKNVRKKYQK